MIRNREFALFLILVGLLALQRISELVKSARHERLLHSQGGVEVGASHFPWMRFLHVAWLAATVMEATWRGFSPSAPWLGLAALTFFLGQTLRLLAMETLGSRWTARIYCVPKEALICRGIYKYLRHPNYMGVVLEIASLPLIFGCWITAITFTVLNAGLLSVRIKTEDKALRQYALCKEV